MNIEGEFRLQRLKGSPSRLGKHSALDTNLRSENCRWYYGHDVQAIISYDQTFWTIMIIPAHSTRSSASEDSIIHDIHLTACSNHSLPWAVHIALVQLGQEIASKCRVDNDSKTLHIDNSSARCSCQHSEPSPVVTDQEDKIRELEARLRSLETQSVDGIAVSGDGDIPGGASTLSILQKIESRLEAIEQQMHRDAAERICATRRDADRIQGVTDIADIQDDQPNLSAQGGLTMEIPDPQLGAQYHGPVPPDPSSAPADPNAGPPEPNSAPPDPTSAPPDPYAAPPDTNAAPPDPTSPPPDPNPASRPHLPSPTPSSKYDTNPDDQFSVTDMTPSASTTERSVTPRVWPDEAAEYNREVMREEIIHELAGAMVSMVRGILRGQGGGEGN